jgi:hypothetical protein
MLPACLFALLRGSRFEATFLTYATIVAPFVTKSSTISIPD